MTGNFHLQISAWYFKIEVLEGIFAGLDFLHPLQTGDNVLFQPAAGAYLIPCSLLFRAGFVLIRGICQDQGMFAFLMFEKVEYAFFFKKPGNKVKVCFPVLYTVVPLFIAIIEKDLVVQKPFFTKDFFRYVRHGKLLEYP